MTHACQHGILPPHRCRDCEQETNDSDVKAFAERMALEAEIRELREKCAKMAAVVRVAREIVIHNDLHWFKPLSDRYARESALRLSLAEMEVKS